MGIIIKPGERIHSGFCLMCGTDLIIPWNDYQCCTECTNKLEYHKKTAQMNKGKHRKKKRNILMSDKVMRQVRPIGGIPE